jgi:hypothetical protein
MVSRIRCGATNVANRRRRVAGICATVLLGWLGAAAGLLAQQPPVHYLHQGVMPPGAIGRQQLERGGPLCGFYQPVEIKAPPGALVSLAVANRFEESQATPRKAGFLIGEVYRLRVTNIPGTEGAEVFPSIEVIDRLYAPVDQQRRFAIPVELTADDLQLALAGKFVTRVIYLEDPHNALPAREDLQTQHWFEAAAGQDPLAVADTLGRPVAILRLGGRLPDSIESPDLSFFFGSPTFMPIAPEPSMVPGVKKQGQKPRDAAPSTADNAPSAAGEPPAPIAQAIEAPSPTHTRSASEGQKP